MSILLLIITHSTAVNGSLYPMPKDKTDINFEVGESSDSKSWTLIISCDDGLNEADFAAACVEFGTDILEGTVSLEEALPVDKVIRKGSH